jgi:hemoglobin
MLMIKKDIENRDDVELLINSFYDKVKPDPVIGFIFTDIMKINWQEHLPAIYNFWENTILYTGNYSGNLMQIHRHINDVTPLSAQQFKRWTDLFCATVDELFEGDKAILAKQRAVGISTTMQIKILHSSF